MNPLMQLIGGGTAQNGTGNAKQIIAKMIAAAATGQNATLETPSKPA